MTALNGVASLTSEEVLASTREMVRRGHAVEADLLVLLGEIDERKLYLDAAYPSLFAFCVQELRFSEEAAYYRITVARAARRLPAIIAAIRSGEVHLAGMRVLVPHLTEENHRHLLARAAWRSKRDIEELVAALAPRPPVASAIRKVPEHSLALMRPMGGELRADGPTGEPGAPQAEGGLRAERPTERHGMRRGLACRNGKTPAARAAQAFVRSEPTLRFCACSTDRP
jgi:hypothetical protein